MRRLACLVACAGCDALFRVDAVAVVDGQPSPVDAPAVDAPPDAPPTYCGTLPSPPTLFCADFDSPATSMFQSQSMSTNASLTTVAVTMPTPTSSPKVLLAAVPASSGGATIALDVQMINVMVFSGKIEFDVLPTCAGRDTVATVTWPQPNNLVVSVVFASSQLTPAITNGGCTTAMATGVPALTTAFNHVSIMVTTTSVTMSINNTPAASVNCTMMPLSTAPMLSVGASVTTNATACTTLVDTVVVTGS